MPLEALILDYGNVLSHPQPSDWCEPVASHIGVPLNVFRDAYWQHRSLYDAGLPAAEYWRRVLATLGHSSAVSNLEAITASLVEADVASWTEYREEVWHLAESFRHTGGRTAFLSNGVPEAMARIRADRHLERWFDVVVVSCEVGAAKPDPAIFQMCLSQLGVGPRHALFVDDRIENIEAAASLGIHTFHFVGADAVSRLERSVRSFSAEKMSEVKNDRERPTLVLLPAMLCNDELYRPQIERLRDLVEPITLTVAEATMAEAATEVLRRAPPKFLLAGTSYGGSLALEVVAREPARVLGLWLMGCNPGPHRDPAAARRRNHRVQNGEFEGVVEELASTITCEQGPHALGAVNSFRSMARQAGPDVFVSQNTALLNRPDRRPDVARIACPTLLVWGREDRLAAPQHGADMSALIPGARLVVLDRCGHLPTLEQPDVTVALAREWLGQISAKAPQRGA